jgi:hypothetical protein
MQENRKVIVAVAKFFLSFIKDPKRKKELRSMIISFVQGLAPKERKGKPSGKPKKSKLELKIRKDPAPRDDSKTPAKKVPSAAKEKQKPAVPAEHAEQARLRHLEIERLLREFEEVLQALSQQYFKTACIFIDADGKYDINDGALIPFRRVTDSRIRGLQEEHRLTDSEKGEFRTLRQMHSGELRKEISAYLEKFKSAKLRAREDALRRQHEAVRVEQVRLSEMQTARETLEENIERLRIILTKQKIQLRSREAIASHRQVLLLHEQIQKESPLPPEEQAEWLRKLDALIEAMTEEGRRARFSVPLQHAQTLLKERKCRRSASVFEGLAMDEEAPWDIRRQAFVGAAASYAGLKNRSLARDVIEAGLETTPGDTPITI